MSIRWGYSEFWNFYEQANTTDQALLLHQLELDKSSPQVKLVILKDAPLEVRQMYNTSLPKAQDVEKTRRKIEAELRRMFK